jgi:hypothetical protein
MHRVDTSYLEKQAIDGSYSRNILARNGVFHGSCTTMNFDDVLFGLILCGIGLAVACFRSEYLMLRKLRAAARRKEGVTRELHMERLAPQADNGQQAARNG